MRCESKEAMSKRCEDRSDPLLTRLYGGPWDHEKFRGHRRKLFDESFGLSVPLDEPDRCILELSGIYGAGFGVLWSAWGLRLSLTGEYRLTNERRGLTPISGSGSKATTPWPALNRILIPKESRWVCDARLKGGEGTQRRPASKTHAKQSVVDSPVLHYG